MGLLIGPLPDHKRIFDVYKPTRLRVSDTFFFFYLQSALEKMDTQTKNGCALHVRPFKNALWKISFVDEK